MEATALVTGATRGIGRALACELAQRGVTVYATGRGREALEDLKTSTGSLGAPFDLALTDAPTQLYRAACQALGGAPDFLINNAGFNSRKAPWAQVTAEELDQQYAVNLRAPALLCGLALSDMQKRAQERGTVGGHLVNVLSTVVHFGNETMGAYTAMKHGLHGLTQVLIKEARRQNVKVSGIYPGGTDTDFRSAQRPEYLRAESVATMIANVLLAPSDVVVHELTFRPMIETNF